MIATLNAWKSNSSAWVRIWRAETGYQVAGEDLPSPPASLALLLARPLAGQATPQWAKGARLAEFEMKAGDFAVTGSKTLQAEVKE